MRPFLKRRNACVEKMPGQLMLTFTKPSISPARASSLPGGPLDRALKKLNRMKGKQYLYKFNHYLISDFIVSQQQVLILTKGGKNLIIPLEELKQSLKDFLRVDPS